MTNAEEIETLRANYPDACFEQLREAVDKSIKDLEAPDWVCPICRRKVEHPFEHCRRCGQAIEWSEE